MALTDTKQNPNDVKSLLEIAKSLAGILDDSKGFQKAVKDAYSISEAEQAKADEARNLISTYADKVAALKQAEADNDDFKKALEQDAKNLKSMQVDLDKKEIEYNKRDIVLKQSEREFAGTKKDLEDRETKLQNAVKQLEIDSDKLDTREKEIEEKEEALRIKAEKLRGVLNE